MRHAQGRRGAAGGSFFIVAVAAFAAGCASSPIAGLSSPPKGKRAAYSATIDQPSSFS